MIIQNADAICSSSTEEELQAKSFGKELSRQEFDSLLVSWQTWAGHAEDPTKVDKFWISRLIWDWWNHISLPLWVVKLHHLMLVTRYNIYIYTHIS